MDKMYVYLALALDHGDLGKSRLLANNPIFSIFESCLCDCRDPNMTHPSLKPIKNGKRRHGHRPRCPGNSIRGILVNLALENSRESYLGGVGFMNSINHSQRFYTSLGKPPILTFCH